MKVSYIQLEKDWFFKKNGKERIFSESYVGKMSQVLVSEDKSLSNDPLRRVATSIKDVLVSAVTIL